MLLLSCSAVPDSVTPWTVAGQAFLSMWFSRQKYWSRLPFLPLHVLPNPGTESMSSEAPALPGRFFYHWATSEAFIYTYLFSYSELPMWHSSKESTCHCRWCKRLRFDPWIGKILWENRVGSGNLLKYSCLENSMDRWAWQATVHGVTKSWTQLSTCTHNLPCSRLHFHFVDYFLQCCKAFKFDLVSLVSFCFCFLCLMRHFQKNIAETYVKEYMPIFSPENFMISGLKFEFVIHFEFIFIWHEKMFYFHCFICCCSALPSPVIAETIFSLLYNFCPFCHRLINHMCMGLFWLFNSLQLIYVSVFVLVL